MTDEDQIKLLATQDAEDKSPSKKAGWQMIMVFCNGILLTIISFVTLLIYIDKSENNVVEEKMALFSRDVLMQMRLASDLFDMTTQVRDIDAALEKPEVNDLISSLSYLKRKDDSLRWGVQHLYNRGLIDFKDLQPLIRDDNQNLFPGDVLLYSHNSANYAIKYTEDGGFYVALFSDNYAFNNMDKDRYGTIYRARLFDVQTDGNMADITFIDDDKIGLNDISQHIHNFEFSGRQYQLILNMLPANPVLFGDKLPFIVLLFGCILTFIGTLFVRNNQKQTLQIQTMNDVLEDKNHTLQAKLDELERVKDSLSENEAEYKAVVNAVQDVLFELDVMGNIVFLNESWEHRTGLDVDLVHGEDIFKFMHADDENRARSVFFDFLKKRESMQVSARLQSAKKGQYRSVDITFSVVRKDASDIPHVIGTMTDVEDKKQAQRALSEVEKHYSKIVENAAGGIYQLSPEGVIMSANPAYAHIFGYDSVEDMVEKGFRVSEAYTSDQDRQSYLSMMNRDDAVRNFEFQARKASGDLIWLNENARIVRDSDENVLYFEGSIEDITARKNAEMDLIKAKMNSDLASRAKSDFLANMSHELRTPLNSIIGFSEIIKGEVLGEIKEKSYVEYASEIYTSGTRLLGIINEILGISKIEAGDRQLNETVVSVKDITQGCIDLMASKIENQGVLVHNNIADSVPSIVAEELAFKQIMMNIISNAVKFTPEGGNITIDAEYEGHDLRVSITDTGVGIDEADIQKALSPFGQIDNALSRSNSGTGLGLTLVDSLMRLHGGKLELVSQKGFGTTVILVIPEKRVADKKNKKAMSEEEKVANFSDYKK